MTLQPGEVIDGKYRIVRLVGEGGMGAVYEGENIRIKRTVAIKVLHASVAEKTDVVQRFEREAQAAGRIGSEHIVEVLDLGNLPSGERFMVMEFLEGEDLTTRIKNKKRLTPHECVPLMHQILEGLTAAHEASIIHRDLKPDNIFILTIKGAKRDFIKILDFGVSKFSALDNEMSMTRTGAVMGTPYYMSPEQAKGSKVDNRSDLYAIGVVLYQMVTGRVPFNASSFNELLFKIALETPEPIAQLVPDCPQSFVDIVDKAMAREPDGRFQTAREFQDALTHWQMTAPAAVMAIPKPTLPPRKLSSPNVASPLGDSGGGIMASMPPPLQPAAIPGTLTPPGGLGLSSAALSLTPTPKKKNTMMVALVCVSVGIVATAGVGAWLLTRPGPAANAATMGATTAADTATAVEPSSTGEPDDTDEADPADSATPVASASASATADPKAAKPKAYSYQPRPVVTPTAPPPQGGKGTSAQGQRDGPPYQDGLVAARAGHGLHHHRRVRRLHRLRASLPQRCDLRRARVLGDRHVILAPACVDCGACGVICPRCAIRDQAGNVVLLRKSAERPVAVVDERSCTGCQRCVWTCSRAAMVLRPWSPAEHFQVAQVAVRRCVGCGLCALDCLHEAIELGARQAALSRHAAVRALSPAVCLAGKCV